MQRMIFQEEFKPSNCSHSIIADDFYKMLNEKIENNRGNKKMWEHKNTMHGKGKNLFQKEFF